MMQLAPTAHGRLRTIIELKALHTQAVERLRHGTLLPFDRKDFRRIRRPTGRDVHMTEQLKCKQHAKREHRSKQKHLEQLNLICVHRKEMVAANCAHHD
jgi:ATP-dependent helicase STH1/SNF2